MLLAFLIACLSTPESTDPVEPSCGSCHGSEVNAAPPTALGGITDPEYLGNGAHQIHMTGGANTKAMGCGECHPFPETLDAEGHIDTPWPAEVTWGEVAKTRGEAAPWDREEATCTVWCHGTSAPDWVGGDASCGTCHGLPPEAPHPQVAECGNCHPPSSKETHVDGIVQLGGGTTDTDTDTDTGTETGTDTGTKVIPGCTDCHGEGDDPSPPPDSDGNTDPTLPTVGAHEVHVDGTSNADGFSCTTCHIMPTDVSDPGHLTDDPSDVTFGGVAVANGATPTYDGLTCTNTYCHDNGGQAPAPEWTDASMPRSCRNCHESPPPAPHPNNPACENCHGSVAGPNFTIADVTKHIDGNLDF